jgi:hypothetical protein
VGRPIEYPLAFFAAAVFLLTWHFITFTGYIYCTECGRSQLYRSVGAAAQFALSRDENGSDTDGYHWYRICFHIYIRIRIRIRIV